MQYTLHSRLFPGNENEYDRVHATIPPLVDAALRRAGIRSWKVWRHGLDTFDLVDTDDFAAADAVLASDPAVADFHTIIGPLFEIADAGPLPLVWALPETAPNGGAPEASND